MAAFSHKIQVISATGVRFNLTYNYSLTSKEAVKLDAKSTDNFNQWATVASAEPA